MGWAMSELGPTPSPSASAASVLPDVPVPGFSDGRSAAAVGCLHSTSSSSDALPPRHQHRVEDTFLILAGGIERGEELGFLSNWNSRVGSIALFGLFGVEAWG
ncbi:hypothetical protein ABZP36_003244 [Zizania latifolia]